MTNETSNGASRKKSFLKIANLRDLSVKDVIKYVKNLHKHIRLQDKKLKKIRNKFKKCQKLYLKTLVDNLEQKVIAAAEEPPETEDPEPLADVDEQPSSQIIKDYVQDIKNAAENAQQMAGYIYEPTSGLYYHSETGYYYNAEMGLYYDGTTGYYYKFNEEKNIYEYHFQVELEKPRPENKDKKRSQATSSGKNKALHDDAGDKDRKTRDRSRRRERSYSDSDHERRSGGRKRHRRDRSRHRSRRRSSKRSRRSSSSRSSDDRRRSRRRVYEDGELSESSGESDASSGSVEVVRSADEKYEDIAKKYPPSLRLIVQETNLPKLKVGTLFIVTYIGGVLGREGDHEVVIPDINISKVHLKFVYNKTKEIFQCIDMGSRNGTILNNERISSSKRESIPRDIVHGSVLQVALTKLLCHVHRGNTTCGHCEPGLVGTFGENVISKSAEPTFTHKEGLKMLQKRYGLQNEKYENTAVPGSKDYSDRADKRRKEVGSSHHHEKTESASLQKAIPVGNKGFKMLSKLGWSEGQSLGKSDSGIKEPIPVMGNEGTTGLGCDVVVPQTSRKLKHKTMQWAKAQARYDKLNRNEASDSD